jgi:hypothetical protein
MFHEHGLTLLDSELYEIVRVVNAINAETDKGFTYTSTQATICAGCLQRKHTPIRNDEMGGYVCLTCIDKELERLQGLQPPKKTPVPEAPKPAATPALPTPEMIAAAIAHRACCGVEHNTLQGKIHGFCIVCGVPWPCRTAKAFLFSPVGVREGGAS